ncbi:MAG TPA: Lpg1974 family pore-forming outer membrane protein, partial [Vineibacter sp.]|nr:Lpg1974 family pore-forming outer membrane protein [Vineibacter sp.]
MRRVVLAGAAFGALTAGTAQAQVQMPGFFGSLTGWYSFEVSGDSNLIGPSTTTTKGNLDDGWGGKIHVGYAWASGFDVAAGAQSTWLGRGRPHVQGLYVNAEKANVQAYDLEVGYNLTGGGGSFLGVRVFLGARYANFDHRGRGADASGALTRTTDAWGIGPRIGADASLRLVGDLSVFGGLGTSFLFGKVKERTASPGFPTTFNDSRLIWQLDAQIGLNYEIAPRFNIAAGYRLDYWDGAGQSGAYVGGGFGRNGRLNHLIHGPFIRLAYNWGAPPPGVAAPPPPGQTKSFIVFFDFDRANLTPTALQTISQAAAQAKAGRSTRIDVTGHADRSG